VVIVVATEEAIEEAIEVIEVVTEVEEEVVIAVDAAVGVVGDAEKLKPFDVKKVQSSPTTFPSLFLKPCSSTNMVLTLMELTLVRFADAFADTFCDNFAKMIAKLWTPASSMVLPSSQRSHCQ